MSRSGEVVNRREEGSARTLLLVAACFLLGIGVSTIWFSQRSGAGSTAKADGKSGIELSAATRSALQQLRSPVELRFYSVLDRSTVAPALQAYAERINQLVDLYEKESGGRLKITRIDSGANSAANSAHGDGLKAFNLDKGDACYLGIAVAQDGRKESLPYLAPEWEAALEPDLTRAILRVSQPAASAETVPARVDPAAVETVKKAIPNLDAVTLEEGTRLLREAALNEFRTTAQEVDAQIKAAQQKVLQAQSTQSEAEKEAAIKELQELQTKQMEKLKQVAANSKAQIDALQQLKTASK